MNPDSALPDSAIEVVETRGLQLPFQPPLATTAETRNSLALLYQLPLHLGTEASLDRLLEIVVEGLVTTVPGATRGAFLLKDSGREDLLLKAHIPAGQPSVSLTLARRAMEQKEAFIWVKGDSVSSSQLETLMETGMYSPVIWQGQTFGVLCVDNSESGREFTPEDLQLLVAVAQYAAMAIANNQVQADQRRNTELLERLLTNFSPKIRKTLIDKARHGRLRLGGEKSEVTLLISDIRGFTRISAGMTSDDVVGMLNEYLPPLTNAIFKYDGTVDKFIGDAILAVFGSPQADPNQHFNAVSAALEMQEAVRTLNASRSARHDVICEVGIGIHCGEVLHGFIGAAERMEFTVIGDAVNRTSRYCSGASGGDILLSPEVYQRVWRGVEAETASVATKHEGDFKAFRVKGAKVSGRGA